MTAGMRLPAHIVSDTFPVYKAEFREIDQHGQDGQEDDRK